ncbi:MAG: catalase [Eubacterium sp.]|nr:catalase [Eubacterium sp.]
MNQYLIKKVRCLWAVLFVALFFTICTKSVAAVVSYTDANTEFASRTKEQVAQKYSRGMNAGETYVDGDYSTYYKTPAAITSPYHQGVVTDDTLKAMQGMTEFYRWLVGVDGLTQDCVQNESLQYQALDRNFEFNHVIQQSSKPADMAQALWDQGFECNHNILAWNYTPQGSITGWMNEGYNLQSRSWDTYGHRYALVRPKNVIQQFGYSGAISIGKYTQVNGHNYHEAFSAFPSAGYMPKGLVNASECGWHVDLNSSYLKVTNSSGIQVTITNETSGQSFVRSVSAGTVQYSNPSITFVQPEDAVSNRYQNDYTVVITGLVDVKTNTAASLTYHVKFFDEALYADAYVESAQPLGYEKLLFYQNAVNATYLKKAAAALGMEVEVTAESGLTVTVPVHGKWTLDETNQCYVNSVDTSQLPGNMIDKRGILNRVEIPYIISSNYYDQYNWLQLSKSNVLEGASGYFRVYHSISNFKRAKIFKVKGDETNGFYGEEAYDTKTFSGYEDKGDGFSYFNISSFKPEDTGEYISVFFYDGEGLLQEGKVGRVSISTVNLKVTRTSPETTTPEVTTQEPTTENVAEGLEINGCQINYLYGGVRTIYTVTDTIDGKQVVERGLTYGVGGYANPEDVSVGSNSEYVASFATGQNGILSQNYSNTLTTGTSYGMTLKFAAGTTKEFQTIWYIRVYAKLSDGTVVQGPLNYYQIYDLADFLYQNRGMPNQTGHDYLYNYILKVVKPDYIRIPF